MYLSQHYAKLQIDIVQKDLEIESLRKELASHQVNEEQRKKLQDELDEMVLKRKALLWHYSIPYPSRLQTPAIPDRLILYQMYLYPDNL